MNIQIRLPGILLLASIGVAAAASPVAGQTITSVANQVFGVAQPSTAISPITVKDAATPTIKAAKDIRIRIPAGFPMTWNTAVTTATITGTGAGKVSTTVSYEDAGYTVVIDALTNFNGNDQITVSGLEFRGFTAVAAGTKLQLVVDGAGAATKASDGKTIQIVAATISAGANLTFTVGQAPTAMSEIVVTDASTPLITAANDIRIRIPSGFNMTWNTALTTATIAGADAAKVSSAVSYEDGGKTLVLNVTTDFTGGDQIKVSGLQYINFTAPSATDNLELEIFGPGSGTTDIDAKTIQIVAPTMASAANQLFFVGQASTAMSPITITDAATPTITTAQDLRIRIPASFNMTWNTALTTATITGGAASKVSKTVTYADGGRTLVLTVTSNFGGGDQIIVSGLEFTGFTAPSAADYLQLVVDGAGAGTAATDSRTIQVATPPAMASAANQSFAVGQAPTGVSPITVTDAAGPIITAANDIRIRIPSGFNMTWNTALTSATITGSGAAKVSPTVSYEDAGKTLVLDVTTSFAGSDQVVVSGLQYMGFTAPSASDRLQLVVSGPGGTTAASDSRNIQIVQPTVASAANQVFVVGQAAAAMSPITVTDAATPTVTAAKDLRIRIPSGLNTTWNTALTTATVTGSGAGKVSPAVTYEDAGQTLVLDVTSDFAGSDQIVVSGLQYTGFTAPSAAASLQLVVDGSGGGTSAADSRTIQVVQPTIASAASQTFVVGDPATAMSAITITDAATPSISAAQDIRVRIPATLNMVWNTALTTATLTGGAASKVSPTVSYEDGGKTLVLNVTTNFAGADQILVSGLGYTSFAAASAPASLQLVVSGSGGGTSASDSRTIQIVAPTIASAANQVFAVGQSATAMSPITITDAATPSITKNDGIRIRIPATFNMTWNTALTTATVGGSASGKVSKTVTYADGGKTLVITASANFAGGDQLVISGLQYTGFTAASAPDYLQLVVSGSGGGTAASDSRTIQIVAPTMASAASQVFVVGQAPAGMSPITITDVATPIITAANDIRVRIPTGLNMSWNTALTAATITGSGAGKVSPTVSYEDAGKTLVLNVTSNFAGNDQIVVAGLQYTSFTAPSAASYLQLAVSGAASGAAASDSRTITIVQPTIASAANQVFVVGQAPTAVSPITVTDAATPSITAANDLRLRIPATLNTTWNTALATATLTGSGAAKVSSAVSYEDGGRTLVLNVTANFAANDQVVVSGLAYMGFTAPSAADYLQLVVLGAGGGTNASDTRTIQVVQPTIASAANQVFVVGQAATAMSAITVTDAATPSVTAARDIRVRIPATLNMTWNTALTTATLTGGAASKVSPTVSYEDGGKTLVLNVTTNFAGADQIVVSGLQYTSFTAPSAPDYLQLVVTGSGGGGSTNASDSRTIQIVQPTIASAADQLFIVGQPATAMAAITVTDAASPTITTANDIRIRIPSSFNMTWNTAVTTASITGSGSSKVSKTVSYEDGGKTLVISVTTNFTAGDRIVVSGLQYTGFTAASAPDYLQLVVSGSGGGTAASDSHTIQIVAPTIASATNQLFVIGEAPTAISPITVTDAPTPTITAAQDIRIRIPSSFSMTWNTALTTATITGSGAGKVSSAVSYEDGGKTLVLNVTANFVGNDQIVVSGLQYMSFTAASASDYLQLVIGGSGGSTAARDSRTITIVQPTIASAANQVFVGGQAPVGISPITVTDATMPSITAANDIRIRIPATFNMTWNTGLTTATIAGSAAGKVSPTVSYEDGGKTLVLNVTTNFAGSDQIVVSGLQYANFTGLSAPDYLQLVVFGPGANTAALDSRTIQIVAPTISSSRNNIYEVGEGPTATSPITVTDAASPTITVANDIRIRIPATLNMRWDTGRTTATLAGGAAGKVSTTVSYEDGGRTLVLTVTANFAAADQVVVSGLRFVNFTALSPPDRLQLVIGGAGANTAGRDDKTIVIATPTVFTGVFKWGVFGDAGISMGSGGLSDSYDSRVAPYNPATAGSNGDLASNIDISLSDAIVRGDVSAVGNVYNTAGVQGNVITSAQPIPQDPVLTCPTVAYTQDIGHPSHGVSYDPTTGALVVDGNGNLTLTGIFYYFSSITLTGGGTITFDNGGRHADIWVSTDLKSAGGSIVNTSTMPTGLEIWACGNPAAPSQWTLSGASSNVYMSLYAPNHDLTVNGSGDIFGAFIVKTFSASGGAKVHFDEALGFVSGPIYYGNPYGVSLSPHTATAGQLPSNGTNYPMVFTVLNTGSSNTTDNFDLLVKRRPGTVLGAVSITGSGVTQGANPDSARLSNLADGASAAVTATYSVGNVPVGTTDTLVFTARSVGGPTYSDSAKVTVTVVRPSLSIGRAVSPNGSLAPGTVLNYALTITNSGTSNAAGVSVVDTLPSALQFKVGSVATTLPAGVSALLQYSSDGGATWAYAPVSGACSAPAGYDRCVNRIRWQLQNPLGYTAPDNSGTLEFVAQIR